MRRRRRNDIKATTVAPTDHEQQQRQQLSQSELARHQHSSNYRHLVDEDIFHRNRANPKIKETLRFIEKLEQEDPTLIDAPLEKEGQ